MSSVLKSIKKFSGSLFGKSPKILESRFVLYSIFILSFINIYVLLLNHQFNALSVFFLTGVIVSAFSKNMIVILFSAIVVTNLVKEFAPTYYEGFDGESADEKKKKGYDEDGLENDQTDSSKMTLKEDIDKVIENLEGVDPTKSGNKKDIDEIKDNYSELLGIQKDLLTGIKNVATPLEQAEKIIEKLTEKMEGMKSGK